MLPDRSILIGQKLVENVKINKNLMRFLSNFQTLTPLCQNCVFIFFRLRPMVIETVSFLHKQIKSGKNVLVEGANAAMLDIDFGKC